MNSICPGARHTQTRKRGGGEICFKSKKKQLVWAFSFTSFESNLLHLFIFLANANIENFHVFKRKKRHWERRIWKESSKGPQWVLVVLGEWLNGVKGLAGKLGGGVVRTVGGHIEPEGGWVLGGYPAVCLIEFLERWHGWQTPHRPTPHSSSFGDTSCAYACLLGQGVCCNVWGERRLLFWRKSDTAAGATFSTTVFHNL